MSDDIAKLAAGEGPQPLPTKYTCHGCRHLTAEPWREYMYEDDEWDSGISAKCTAVSKSLGAYWSQSSPPPDWCPFRAHLQGASHDHEP